MVQYHPLDASRNEIRVIRLHSAVSPSSGASGGIECTLEHVFLDDYSDVYRTFLELDGAARSPLHRALLWDFVTTQSALVKRVGENAAPWSLVGRALDGFSASPVYQRDMFRNATTYLWGDFFALSYEWGDVTDTAEIIVNGERTAVTKNLKDALQRLCTWWRAQHRSDPVSLWVDALCINQADIPERNEQVRRMRQIYSTAIKVLIMTGPDVEDPQATSQLLDRVFAASLKRDGHPEEIGAILNEGNLSGWKGVCEIASRSYWRRLWIIQEVLLANTGAWLCYGNQFCLASTFLDAVSVIVENFHYARGVLADASGGESEDWILRLDRIENFLRFQEFRRQGLDYPNLYNLLYTACRARQFDPRDKIYGILGMVDDRIQVEPDYRLSLVEIYRNFTVEVIKATCNLGIIYQRVLDRKTGSAWPSWVPDWSADTTDDSESIAPVSYLDTRAAGDSVHTYKVPDTPDQLYCEGIMIDTVGQLACTGKLIMDHNIHDSGSLPQREEPMSIYKDSATVREALWSSLTLNRSVVGGETAMAYLLGIPCFDGRGKKVSFLHVIDRFQQCNRNLLVGGKPLISHFPAWSEAYSKLPNDLEIVSTLSRLMNPLTYRRFMVTERGRVGMAPRVAQLGDSIFIVKGCNAPLILRRATDGAYSLVGECYVDGVMHGEAMADLEAGKYEATGITIC